MNYKKILAILYFILFTTPILSPNVGFRNTIYLYWFIPLFDIDFLKFVIKIRPSKRLFILMISSLIIFLLLREFSTILKLGLLAETILYLFYTYKMKYLKYFFWGINLNVAIASLQFVTYYINPDIATFLGPSNIAKLVWGDHATLTFTNMFTEFGIVKVSGWSREHGFFNALMMMSFLLYYYFDFENKNKYQYFVFVLGFIMSISKNSILILFIPIAILIKKYLNKIPIPIAFVLIIIVGCIVGILCENYGLYDPNVTTNYESFIHRFSGYNVLLNISISDLLKGISSIGDLPNYIYEICPYLSYVVHYLEFCGLPALLIHHGIIVFIVYILLMNKFLNYKSFGFCVLTLVTITTTYITLTAFVCVAYFIFIYIENNYSFPSYLESVKL